MKRRIRSVSACLDGREALWSAPTGQRFSFKYKSADSRHIPKPIASLNPYFRLKSDLKGVSQANLNPSRRTRRLAATEITAHEIRHGQAEIYTIRQIENVSPHGYDMFSAQPRGYGEPLL
jgi:hypothetical protein